MTDFAVVRITNTRDEELELFVGRSGRHLRFRISHLEMLFECKKNVKEAEV